MKCIYTPIDGTSREVECPDRTALKWELQGYVAAIIPPSITYAFDAFSIDSNNLLHVYLHSQADIHPRRPVIAEEGEHFLNYIVYADRFPLLSFDVKLMLTGDWRTTTAELTPLGNDTPVESPHVQSQSMQAEQSNQYRILDPALQEPLLSGNTLPHGLILMPDA